MGSLNAACKPYGLPTNKGHLNGMVLVGVAHTRSLSGLVAIQKSPPSNGTSYPRASAPAFSPDTCRSRPWASSRVGTAGAVNWSELLDRPDVLVLDTETTGLGPEAEVIEIAVIDTTGAVLLDTLSLPQDHIPKAASDIHGLTYDRLKRTDAPPWPEVHDQLLTVLEGVSVVLGWNVSFDHRVLQQTAKRHGLRLHKLPWRDLLADYRAIRPTGRHRLGDAANREGVTVKGSAHRALTDCQTVLAVMQSVADGRLY